MTAATNILSAKEVKIDLIDPERSIGTHSGPHHTDEVTSCVLLRKLIKDAQIIRTRDQACLDACSVVVDVGASFDAKRKRFDHHQRDFDGYWSDELKRTKLSSAGLVWKFYGEELLKLWGFENFECSLSPEPAIKNLLDLIYVLIFEEIDANDNGVRTCNCSSDDVKYIGGVAGVVGLVASENVPWDEATPDESAWFRRAMDQVEAHVPGIVKQLASHWLDAVAELTDESRTRVVNESTRNYVVEMGKWARFGKFLRLVRPDDKCVGFIYQQSGGWVAQPTPGEWKVLGNIKVRRGVFATKEQALAHFA